MSTWEEDLHPRVGKSVPSSSVFSESDKKAFASAISGKAEVMVKVARNNEKVNGTNVVKSPTDKGSLQGLIKYMGSEHNEVKDEDGRVYVGEDMAKAVEKWKGISTKSNGKRVALHVVLSMPPTPYYQDRQDDIAKAVENFCAEEWSGHQYIIAHHRRDGRPHSHVCVRVASTDGTRKITPRFDDLNRYRTTFARNLEDLGIEANATSRLKRLSTRVDLSPAKYKRLERMYGKGSKEMHERMFLKPDYRQESQAFKYRMAAEILSRGSNDDKDLGRRMNEYVDAVLGQERGRSIVPEPENAAEPVQTLQR